MSWGKKNCFRVSANSITRSPVSLPLVHAGVRWRYLGLKVFLSPGGTAALPRRTARGTTSAAWDNSSQQTWQLHFGFVRLSVSSSFDVNFYAQVCVCVCAAQKVLGRASLPVNHLTAAGRKRGRRENKYIFANLLPESFTPRIQFRFIWGVFARRGFTRSYFMSFQKVDVERVTRISHVSFSSCLQSRPKRLHVSGFHLLPAAHRNNNKVFMIRHLDGLCWVKAAFKERPVFVNSGSSRGTKSCARATASRR